MNRFLMYLFIATTIGVSIWFVVYHFSKKNEISKLQDENRLMLQKETKRIKDSLTFVVEHLRIRNNLTTDSLRLEESRIKLVPYEKLIYADRDVDGALDVISNYKYDTDPKAKGG